MVSVSATIYIFLDAFKFFRLVKWSPFNNNIDIYFPIKLLHVSATILNSQTMLQFE